MVPLIGHEKIKKYFENVIKNSSVGHAYLFSGPEMVGKRSFALELFHSLNNREAINDPDFVMVQPNISEDESKIYIEEIRKLKSFFSLRPYYGPYKFALIDDAHSLTGEASNALLKVLEEPPPFSVIVLVSSLPNLVLPTISSRCEKVMFNEASEKEVSDFLHDRIKGQHLKLDKDDQKFVIKLAGGRIGLISQLLQGDNIIAAKKTVDDLRKLLNSGVYERLDYAKKLHEKAIRLDSPQEVYQPTINYWFSWVSAHLVNSPKNEKIVRNLLSLSHLVSQPQYNHRLALENFLLNL